MVFRGCHYITRSKKATQYFQNISRKLGKSVLQQTGSYFQIVYYDSLNSFTASNTWRMCNYEFRCFAKIDYKSCFDSIYSHVFTWIMERNVVDSKNAKNACLLSSIDRMLMNINGKASNGILVGPEFSRMISEILLEKIDNEVLIALAKEGYEWKRDYKIFRYVDDLCIFTQIPQVRDVIVRQYRNVSSKYLLSLNDQKYFESTTPATFSRWIERTRTLSDKIDHNFRSKSEYKALDQAQQHLVKSDECYTFERMMDEFIVLLKEYPNDKRTIISYLLSTLLKKISMQRDGYKLFLSNKLKKALSFVEFALFMYANNPSFDNTRKVISILVYLDKEIYFSKKDTAENHALQQLINRYAFIFQRAYLPDICDWFLLLNDFHINFDSITENEIVKTAEAINNPIIWANILLYSHYYLPFFNNVRTKLESIIENRIDRITPYEQMLQEEFWYILIFHNCLILSNGCQNKIEKIIDNIRANVVTNKKILPNGKVALIICDYLNSRDGFFNWSNSNNLSEQLTYRTYQRTLFKKYKGMANGLYASIE